MLSRVQIGASRDEHANHFLGVVVGLAVDVDGAMQSRVSLLGLVVYISAGFEERLDDRHRACAGGGSAHQRSELVLVSCLKQVRTFGDYTTHRGYIAFLDCFQESLDAAH